MTQDLLASVDGRCRGLIDFSTLPAMQNIVITYSLESDPSTFTKRTDPILWLVSRLKTFQPHNRLENLKVCIIPDCCEIYDPATHGNAVSENAWRNLDQILSDSPRFKSFKKVTIELLSVNGRKENGELVDDLESLREILDGNLPKMRRAGLLEFELHEYDTEVRNISHH
ncbi:hypothetical protein FA15DRAFT_703742 [Coprinopsis marcescibilis]|uniref:Uncharacterized protein n=1 Tax=Coprinopsis marcescibilis TaxID=230819 RepID=A0A5C3KYR4_COPMA|nr:hypothetical protein FA15DRAFT_703742 [Coprinopsis marcescibilis]